MKQVDFDFKFFVNFIQMDCQFIHFKELNLNHSFMDFTFKDFTIELVGYFLQLHFQETYY